MSTVKSLLSSLRTDLSATAVGAAVGAGAGAEDGAGRPGEVGEYRIRRGDLPGIASAQAGGGGAAEEGGSGSDSDNDGAGGGDRGPPAMERSLDDGSESWSDSDDGSGDGGGGGLGGSPVLVEASGGPSQTPPGAADGGYSLLRPGEPDVLDAACLPFGSSVAVRSTAPRVGGGGERGGPSASSAVLSSLSASAPGAGAGEGPDRGHPRAASAVLDGTGTGGGLWEILVLEGAYSDGGTGAGGGATPPPRGGAAPREPQRPPLGDVLRYGGAVSLRCRHAGNRWLGVRAASVASSPGGGGGRSIEVGFYRTVRGQAERWEVLPSRGDGATVPVGPEAALAAAAAAGGGGSRSASQRGRPRAVRSGDPIVLRNVQTGGLLSLGGRAAAAVVAATGRKRNLSLVTSSYQTTTDGGGSTADDRTLLDFLQHQDRVVPTTSETFRIVHAAAPACPPWVMDAGEVGVVRAQDAIIGGRPYLSGTYLLHPGRDDDVPGGTVRSAFSSSPRKPRPRGGQMGEPLARRPVHAQEQILLDDMLGAMMGLGGRYIIGVPRHVNECAVEFALAPYSTVGGTIDASLGHLLDRMLPLATDYVYVNSFFSARIGRYEFGAVAHALAESIDVLLQEYLSFAAEMESLYIRPQGLTLSKLFVLVQPSMRTMEVLRRASEVVAPLKGGALLNALSNLLDVEFLGDAKSQEVLRYLLDCASVPYLSMLRGWLDRGELGDTYGEFMIYRDPEKGEMVGSSDQGNDWEGWFAIREEQVLSSLLSTGWERTDTVTKLLTAGKYWNAVAMCKPRESEWGCDVKRKKESSSKGSDAHKPSLNPIDLSTYIDASYNSASSTLLSVILRDYQLIEALRVMKRYFLLDQGDFFVHFLDMSQVELLKELKDISSGRVQSWLTLSAQLSTAVVKRQMVLDTGADRSIERYLLSSLRCNFASESLVDRLDDIHASSGGIRLQEARTPSRHLYGAMNRDLTGIEAFFLDFQCVPFPLSLILSQTAISNYQLLFRHLFFVKHVERRLVGTWLDNQAMKEFQSLRKSLAPTLGLRQRMLHFIQNLVYYMMFEVIEPKWQSMESTILRRKNEGSWSVDGANKGGGDSGQTVDDVLAAHNNFLRQTLRECLLTNGNLIRTLTKLMTTCLLYCDQMDLFVEMTQINEERERIAKEERKKRQQNISINSFSKKSRARAKTAMAARNARRGEHLERLEQELDSQSYKRMISRFNEVFNNNLKDFMEKLTSNGDERFQSYCSNLCTRLDYNGFISGSLKLDA